MQNYANQQGCYMEYLTTFLRDQPGYRCGVCGHCQPTNFQSIIASNRIQEQVFYFLDRHLLPRIEKRGTEKQPVHEEGWALSYYGMSSVGKLVRACKYEKVGPFPTELVEHAVEVIRSRYPVGVIDAIVGVPPTKSGMLVENFARQIATSLSITYIPAVVKVRGTGEQKDCTNWVQKAGNVKNAFVINPSHALTGRTILLIDDIYDSGQMLREIGRVLIQAGASAVYPFAIVKTKHSDDQ
jgi:ATP-dependent DNA helicase RecQ